MEGKIRRIKLSFEIFEDRRWIKKFKSINPMKEHKGISLGETAIVRIVKGEGEKHG